MNNEDDNNQPHLTFKFSFRNLFTHRLVAFAVLRKTGIGSVFVINFSLRNIEDGTKTFVKTNKTRTLVFPSVTTELRYKDVMRRVGGGESPTSALGSENGSNLCAKFPAEIR